MVNQFMLLIYLNEPKSFQNVAESSGVINKESLEATVGDKCAGVNFKT